MTRIPIENCIERGVYKILSRNLSIGVYDGNGGFIGIRTKFGQEYLFTEYHWDLGPPYGTVHPEARLNVHLPEDLKVCASLGARDANTGEPIYYSQEKKWLHAGTEEVVLKPTPINVENAKLFKFLKNVAFEEKRAEKEEEAQDVEV